MNRGRWWQSPNFSVIYDPTAMQARPTDVLVGIGHSAGSTGCTVLNHKIQNETRLGGAHASLSEYIAQADAHQVQLWRAQFPQGIRSVIRFLVEDASLDTCMALLLFARHISMDRVSEALLLGAIQTHCEYEHASRLGAWLEYVSLWEQGRYVDGADLRASVACQMAVLAHTHLSNGETDGRPSDASAREGLSACMTLLDAYIEENEKPVGARPPRGVPEHDLADAQFDFEYQCYQLALKSGIRTQLELPLAHSNRSIQIDALFVNDVELSGILKAFARNDVQNSSFKRGFTMLGLYRPALQGNGDDMTISVDPRSGTTLRDLWFALENLENVRWDGQRPSDRPRKGIAHYSNPGGEPRSGAPNEPWYDERGHYTLLGAPKNVTKEVAGSKLGWYADVLPMIWSLYSPISKAVREGRLEIWPMDQVGGRYLRTVCWRGTSAHELTCAPVLHCWLASLSTPREIRHPGDFVPLDEIKVLSLRGGEVVVHADGITFFDDWTSTELDIDGLHRIAHTLANLASEYGDILAGQDLSDLMRWERTLLATVSKTGFRELARKKEQALHLKCRLLQLSGREATVVLPKGDAAVREGIERVWGLPNTRHQLWEILNRVDGVLSQAQGLNQERRQFVSTAILSIAGIYVVVRDFIDVIAGAATQNRFEMAIPNSRQFGIAKSDPQAFAELIHQAKIAGYFDFATLIAMFVVFGVGIFMTVRRYVGSRQAS